MGEPASESSSTGSRPPRTSRMPRPVSFYLFLAIPLVLLLGLQMTMSMDNPKRFALVLSLMFLFFGIVLLRAVMDVFDIARRNVRGKRDAFRDTLGDEKFARKLGERTRHDRRP